MGSYYLKLDSAARIDSQRQIYQLVIDMEFDLIVDLDLFGLSQFDWLLREDYLEGSAFESLIFVLDDDHVVIAGVFSLNEKKGTLSMMAWYANKVINLVEY